MAKILICDDNPQDRENMAFAIYKIGSTCKLVSTPADAYKELQTSRYDVVMIDIQNLVTPGSYHKGDAYDSAL